MTALGELFACVWEAIEADSGPAKRPQVFAAGSSHEDGVFASDLGRFPVSGHLQSALAAADRSGLGRIAALVRASVDHLVWSQNVSYTEAKLGRQFLDNYVSGILTGPEGNLARTAPCSGFVLLGPGTVYLEHSHAPREVYLVLTPDTEWCLDGTKWFGVEAGQVIHHGPWQSHAMRTRATPMLAFAAWLDDGDRNAITI